MLQQPQTKSFLRPDFAINTRIKNDEKLLDATGYDRMLKKIGVNVDWYESQQKYEVKKMKKSNDKRIKQELVLTNDEIKKRRKEKLKELYTDESEVFEQELNSLGLAIVKERY